MSSCERETRGRFRWLEIVNCDEGVTIHTARTELTGGLVVERVNGADTPLVFVTDAAGCEVTLTGEQSAELGAALFDLPPP